MRLASETFAALVWTAELVAAKLIPAKRLALIGALGFVFGRTVLRTAAFFNHRHYDHFRRNFLLRQGQIRRNHLLGESGTQRALNAPDFAALAAETERRGDSLGTGAAGT